MNHNDILRRLRYAFDLSDRKMLALFSAHPTSNAFLSKEGLHARLLKDDHADFIECSDQELSAFLDGLIVAKRGLKKDAATPPPAEKLTRNEILKKLRIALSFRDDDMITTLKLGGANLSKPELSALFRAPNHKHYRPCGNQVLRSFLKGLTKQLRPKD